VEYYNVVNEAEWLLYNQKPDSAIILYEKAFKLNQPKAIDHYRLAEAYALKGNLKSTYHHLKKASEKGIHLSYWMKGRKGTVFNDLYKTDSVFKMRIEKIDKVYLNRLDKISNEKVRDTLIYFSKQDKLYRSISDSMNVFDKKSNEYLTFRKKFAENDSLVGNQLYEYLLENDFPDIYLYGEKLHTILIHLTCQAYGKLKGLLYGKMLIGKVPPNYYASMIDRIGCQCEDKMTYLAYTNVHCKIDYNTALENRKKIGLTIYFKDNNAFPTGPKRWLLTEKK
jgi:hypothetical protein